MRDQLGLVAQRLFTVSTVLSTARVLRVAPVTKLAGRAAPEHETWFEVDVRAAPTRGGVVAI
jgi:hypothetical protein